MKRIFMIPAALLLGALSLSACGDAKSKAGITEVVVYRVKPAQLGHFKSLSGHIHREVRTFPGFISIETVRSAEKPNEFMDIVRWESKQQALSAFKNFAKLPHAARFMAALDGKPVYAGHFKSHF